MIDRSTPMCMFPWVHTYVTPEGNVHACCTTKLSMPAENIKETGNSLKTIAMTNPKIAEIRRKMLAGEYPEECQVCWDWEASGGVSFREYANKAFSHKIDHYVKNTNADGTMNIYEPMYVDVRFSNICNLKCRNCGDVFSSAWAKEKNQYSITKEPVLRRVDTDGKITEELLKYIDTVEVIYWAGGEPLLTDEHYIILEELNRRKKFDIELRYNTNSTVLEIKNRNFIDLISNFKRVFIQSSLDHYGARGEWLRHGAKWDTVVGNIKKIKSLPNVTWSMNTVVNKWNILTLDDFIRYMIDQGLYTREDSWSSSLPVAADPDYYSIKTLPQPLIAVAIIRLENLKQELEEKQYVTAHVQSVINQLRTMTSIYGSKLEKHGIMVADEIDRRRGENWREVFPELANL